MIIESRLDNDLYQWTMGQLVWKYFPDTKVRYEFRNRTFSVPLADCFSIEELQAQFDALRSLNFISSDINWLRHTGYFEEDYLLWLRKDHSLPAVEVQNNNGHLVIEYEGNWADAIFMETPVLAIVSEMYYRRFEALNVEGYRRLNAKIDYLTDHPQIRWLEFGTRRRYSAAWQYGALSRVVANKFTVDSLIGTSNCALARELDIPASGTMSHQGPMVAAALNYNRAGSQPHDHPTPADQYDLAATQRAFFSLWDDYYKDHPNLLVLLPDAYGTEWMLKNMALGSWTGIRQDSGDPFAIGALIIDKWNKGHHNAKEKNLIFSDGLDLRTMSMLVDRFGSQSNVLFGWGTNFTNDLGFEALSLVIKPKSANGNPCVKLSDNPAKATGDPAEILRYKKMLKYVDADAVLPKY